MYFDINKFIFPIYINYLFIFYCQIYKRKKPNNLKSASMQEPQILAYAVSPVLEESDSSVSLQLHTFLWVNNR